MYKRTGIDDVHMDTPTQWQFQVLNGLRSVCVRLVPVWYHVVSTTLLSNYRRQLCAAMGCAQDQKTANAAWNCLVEAAC